MAKKKNARKEENMQVAFSSYIKLQYPDVIFTAESSGIRVTMGIAVKMKKQRCAGKLPDFLCLEPRGEFHGLILELKHADNSPFKKDGSLKSDIDKKTGLCSIKEQARMLDRLKKKGYCTQFVVGLTEAKDVFDWYMKLG